MRGDGLHAARSEGDVVEALRAIEARTGPRNRDRFHPFGSEAQASSECERMPWGRGGIGSSKDA